MKTRNLRLIQLLSLIILLGSLLSCELPYSPDLPPGPGNIILVIGDGMGQAHVTAASRYVDGTDSALSFQSFPVQTSVTTHNWLGGVTDSAAAATAMATGNKVLNGVISWTLTGAEPETLLEYYARFGKRIGLVTSTSMTHATPAAFGAHTSSRDNVNEIAFDYLNQTRPNVLFGGGGYGISATAAEAAGYTVVSSDVELDAVNTGLETHVSGQFGNGHLPYAFDGYGDLPSLQEMTETALAVLGEDDDGFFLMVEGGRIDHASHVNDLERMVHETIALSETVSLIIDWAASRNDTIVLVTADHETGGLSSNIPITAAALPADDTPYWGDDGRHTGVPVPLYVWGKDAVLFAADQLDNTDIYRILVENF